MRPLRRLRLQRNQAPLAEAAGSCKLAGMIENVRMRGGNLRRLGQCAGVLVATALLAGCDLIGQNTFAAAPQPRPATVAAPATAHPVEPLEGRRALVIIDGGTPASEYRQLLGYAVRAALARDRAVRFEVIALVPTLSSAAAGQREATSVMRAIMADGAPASRIELGLRAQPGLATRQVRVYVR